MVVLSKRDLYYFIAKIILNSFFAYTPNVSGKITVCPNYKTSLELYRL